MDVPSPVPSAQLDRLILRMHAVDLDEDDRAAWTALAAWARASVMVREAADASGLTLGTRTEGRLDSASDAFRTAMSLGPIASVRGVPHSR